ncbi:hypothetical protein ALI144C_02145 [Actinosynnema sp. ALI-1.44]|nr:hypothetical protein ALI144C_02145 [Actinosynnema sp. ALI-1.44]
MRQAQRCRIFTQSFEIVLWRTLFKLADLTLVEAKPSPQCLLIERLPEQFEPVRMMSVCPAHLAHMLAIERCPKFVRLEKFNPEVGRWA